MADVWAAGIKDVLGALFPTPERPPRGDELAGHPEEGMANARPIFDLFLRVKPFAGGYAVFAGLGPASEYLERPLPPGSFRLADPERCEVVVSVRLWRLAQELLAAHAPDYHGNLSGASWS